MNFGCGNVAKVVKQAYFNATLSFRQMSTFRQITKLPRVEFCGVLKNLASINLPVWKETLAEALDKIQLRCPITEMKLFNITFKNSMHKLWPSGEYRNEVLFSNDDDQTLFTFTYNVISKALSNDNF
ncbi:unnamed protein product [Diamesa tonsa]